MVPSSGAPRTSPIPGTPSAGPKRGGKGWCSWASRPLSASAAVLISLYYVGFYVVMTGLFLLSMYTLLWTLDPYTPDYQDQLKSPGKSVWRAPSSGFFGWCVGLLQAGA